jgi:hypothetical protein
LTVPSKWVFQYDQLMMLEYIFYITLVFYTVIKLIIFLVHSFNTQFSFRCIVIFFFICSFEHFFVVFFIATIMPKRSGPLGGGFSHSDGNLAQSSSSFWPSHPAHFVVFTGEPWHNTAWPITVFLAANFHSLIFI